MLGGLLVAIGILTVLVQAVLLGVQWWRTQIPQYEPGDLADVSVVTPVQLSVIDPDATELQRKRAGQQVPPLFRFDASVGDEMANRFVDDYDKFKELFCDGLNRTWPEGVTDDDLASKSYVDFQTSFQEFHRDFPLTDQLARTWGGDKNASQLRDQTSAAIRGALSRYVIDDSQQEIAQSYTEIFLSSPTNAGGVRDASRLETKASRLQTRSLQTMGEVRDGLKKALSAAGEDWANYAAEFLRPNVTFDEKFTVEVREYAARDLVVRTNFTAGARLVSAAYPVSPVQSSALRELDAYYQSQSANRKWQRAWAVAFGFCFILTGAFVVQASKRQTRALITMTNVPFSATKTRTGTEAEHVRRGVIANLTGWLKTAFVRRLIQQRDEAITSQADVSQQVEVINKRLTRLHPEIRERVADYERRIAELEKELEDANEVTRELIKTKISLARKELEIEKAKSNLVWN